MDSEAKKAAPVYDVEAHYRDLEKKIAASGGSFDLGRIRAAFDREVTAEVLADILHGDLNISGKVLSFISERDADTVKAHLESLGGLWLFETYPMSLEDVFKYEMRKGGKSYDIEGLFDSQA